MQFLQCMPDDSVDMTITSPPYNFNLRIHSGAYCKRSVNECNKYGGRYSDSLSMEDYFNWQRDCLSELMRVTKGLVFYNIQMITGNKTAFLMLLGHFAKQIKEIIIWDKINAEPAISDRVLNSQYEYIVVFDKRNAISRQFDTFNAKRGAEANVFRINKNHERNIDNHSAMFPLILPRKIMSLFGNRGG